MCSRHSLQCITMKHKRQYLVVRTKYRLFCALLYGSYPMPVMFPYCLIGSPPNGRLFYFCCFAFSFTGSWEMITAQNKSRQPSSSAPVILSCRISQPARAANTDSRLISREAVVGSRHCWHLICSVKATPMESTPVYASGSQHTRMLSTLGSSKRNIQTAVNTAATRL